MGTGIGQPTIRQATDKPLPQLLSHQFSVRATASIGCRQSGIWHIFSVLSIPVVLTVWSARSATLLQERSRAAGCLGPSGPITDCCTHPVSRQTRVMSVQRRKHPTAGHRSRDLPPYGPCARPFAYHAFTR